MVFKLNKKDVIGASVLLCVVSILFIGVMFENSKGALLLCLLLIYNFQLTLRKRSEIYILDEKTLEIKGKNLMIPLDEIKEMHVKKKKFYHLQGATSEEYTFRYFINYKDKNHEIFTTCKNKKGQTLDKVLNKEYDMDYRLML